MVWGFTKGDENINEPIGTQWQIRCAFNDKGCRGEAMNADRDMKRQQLRRITFFHLSPQKNQIFVYHRYFVDDEAEKSFVVGGKKITPKLIA